LSGNLFLTNPEHTGFEMGKESESAVDPDPPPPRPLLWDPAGARASALGPAGGPSGSAFRGRPPVREERKEGGPGGGEGGRRAGGGRRRGNRGEQWDSHPLWQPYEGEGNPLANRLRGGVGVARWGPRRIEGLAAPPQQQRKPSPSHHAIPPSACLQPGRGPFMDTCDCIKVPVNNFGKAKPPQ